MFLLPQTIVRPVRRNAWTTYALIAANVYAHLMTTIWSNIHDVAREFGNVPSDWSPVSLVTAQFIHASWWHLLGNMLFLYLFGEGVEQVAGHWLTLLWYLTAGAAGDLLRLLWDSDSSIPSIGASGCIFGLAGAYAVLFPKEKVRLHFFLLYRYLGATEVSAAVAIGAWLLEQLVVGWIAKATGIGSGVGYGAHIAGLVTGGAMAAAFVTVRHRRILQTGPPPVAYGPPCVRCGGVTLEFVHGLFRCTRCKKWNAASRSRK